MIARRIFFLGLIGLGAAFALSLVSISLVSYPESRAMFDGLASDGVAERFTYELHALVVNVARILAAVVLLICGVAYFLRDRIRMKLGLVDLATELRRDFTLWLRIESRMHLAVLSLCCAVGTVLRSYYLFQPMRSDESWTFLYYVSQPLVLSIAHFASPNNHLLHTLLAQLTTNLFGDSANALRLPALVAGVLLIPASYFLFRQLSGKGAALITAGLVACFPVLVDYSTNARGYSLLLLFSVLLLSSADRIRRRDDTGAKVVFATLAALGLYTVPAFGLPLGGIGLWLFTSSIVGDAHGERWPFIRSMIWTGIGAIALTLFLYLPVILTSGVSSVLANDMVIGDGSNLLMSAVVRSAEIWIDWTQGVPLLVQLMISVAPVRVWLFALPLILGFAASSSATLLKRENHRTIATAMLVSITSVIYVAHEPGHFYSEFGEYSDAEAVSRFLADELQEKDAVVTAFPANRTVNYYAYRQGISDDVLTARSRTLSGDFERMLIVLNTPEASIGSTFESADRALQTNFLAEKVRTEDTIAIGSSRVVIARIVD
jgi:hypothetical protein